ncbi:MAG: EF-hand domain-containing protein [Sulfuricella sp.]|nr:EF-hand domain-containing protein [Sulfuricella sp.]
MRIPKIALLLAFLPFAVYAQQPGGGMATPVKNAHFKQADADGNGSLSRAEMEAHMPKLAKDFEAVDTNHDGQVSREELRTFMKAKRAALKQKGSERFKQADTDGNGTLSREEAEKGMPRLVKNFDAIDTNKDGQISPDEIRAYMKDRMKSRKGGAGAGMR